jgi:ParB-like chromosome segregation protein Spo0J
MSAVLENATARRRNGKRSTRGPDGASGPAGERSDPARPAPTGVDGQRPAPEAPGPEGRPEPPAGALEIRLLPVSRIRANGYNLNEMPAADLDEYAAEVKRLGRLPRPLVVRPAEDAFVLVDGEHGLKAARQAGLEAVPCEVIDVDDFEARRQSYQRNRHGAMNPVALGLMFRQMQEDRNLSQRELAKAIGTSEGTARNALLYAEAFKVRNRDAPDEARATVAGLTVQQVRAYLKRPAKQRNQWLDDGADLDSSDRSTRPTTAAAKKKASAGSGEGTESALTSEGQEAADQGAAEAAASDTPDHAPDRPAGDLDAARSAPHPAGNGDGQAQLERLQDAWEQAGETARRDFLQALLGRPEVAALIRQLLP